MEYINQGSPETEPIEFVSTDIWEGTYKRGWPMQLWRLSQAFSNPWL